MPAPQGMGPVSRCGEHVALPRQVLLNVIQPLLSVFESVIHSETPSALHLELRDWVIEPVCPAEQGWTRSCVCGVHAADAGGAWQVVLIVVQGV